MNKKISIFKKIYLAVVTILFLWFSLFVDDFIGGIGALYVIACSLVYGGVVYPFFLTRPGKFEYAIVFIYFVLLITIMLTPWNSRKVFLKDFDKIQVGMSIEEVEKIMEPYMKGSGWPANPFTEKGKTGGQFEIQGSIIYRHSNDGAYDSDWGIVKFKDNKVLETGFSLD